VLNSSPFLVEEAMAKYRPYDYSQRVMVPVSLEDQLMPGTLDVGIRGLNGSTDSGSVEAID
jgi:hypothetical protein